jgi:hypothetical protein
LHVAFAKACNTQLGGLTAHRGTGALVRAINACCDLRGDDDRNRAGLIAECSALTPAGQADMREHFEQETANWQRAVRGGRP